MGDQPVDFHSSQVHPLPLSFEGRMDQRDDDELAGYALSVGNPWLWISWELGSSLSIYSIYLK